jgi:hypothetical protein
MIEALSSSGLSLPLRRRAVTRVQFAAVDVFLAAPLDPDLEGLITARKLMFEQNSHEQLLIESKT